MRLFLHKKSNLAGFVKSFGFTNVFMVLLLALFFVVLLLFSLAVRAVVGMVVGMVRVLVALVRAVLFISPRDTRPSDTQGADTPAADKPADKPSKTETKTTIIFAQDNKEKPSRPRPTIYDVRDDN